MARGRHAASPLIQVLDAMLLTFNALMIVSFAVVTIVTAMTVVAGGSIGGVTLLVVFTIIIAEVVMAISEFAMRHVIARQMKNSHRR